ncbi:MAG: histidine kinase, partial [Termitinemataceae bacterium]
MMKSLFVIPRFSQQHLSKQRTMKHRLRNRIVLNSLVILLILSLVTVYTAIASMELAKSFDILLQNNLFLKDVRKNLDATQSHLTAYLRAKNSESLKEFIRFSSYLQVAKDNLNQELKNDQLLLLERNLSVLLENYLRATDNTVQAKRGRNVSVYVSQYDEAKKLESLITFLLEKMNRLYLDQTLSAFMGYRSNLSLVLLINLILIALAFLLSTIFMMRYSSIITEPLEHLSESVKAVARGDYSYSLPPYEDDDEIGTLNLAFTQMQRSIQNAFAELNKKAELEKELLEQKMRMLDYQHKLKDAELLALQTQINPHFLYNTLSAGWQLALAEQDETTAEFLEKLAEFIRYVLKPTNRFVPLSEELDCATKYIWLLRLRFGERYQFVL